MVSLFPLPLGPCCACPDNLSGSTTSDACNLVEVGRGPATRRYGCGSATPGWAGPGPCCSLARSASRRGVRSQFCHAVDILPTVLGAVELGRAGRGRRYHPAAHRRRQSLSDLRQLTRSLDNAQYFEVLGPRRSTMVGRRQPIMLLVASSMRSASWKALARLPRPIRRSTTWPGFRPRRSADHPELVRQLVDHRGPQAKRSTRCYIDVPAGRRRSRQRRTRRDRDQCSRPRSPDR